jgi:hypothetical protein
MNERFHYYIISILTIIASGLYIVTDVIEGMVGGFLPFQLILTYFAMATLSLAYLGLYAVNYRKGGATYLIGSVIFSLSYIYFAHSALLALFVGSAEYSGLKETAGLMYEIHGYATTVGGLLIGYVILRKKLFPAWTGIVLVLTIILNVFTFLMGLADIYQLILNTCRNIAFIGMGCHVFTLAKQLDFGETGK